VKCSDKNFYIQLVANLREFPKQPAAQPRAKARTGAFSLREKRDALLGAAIRLGRYATGLRPPSRPPLAEIGQPGKRIVSELPINLFLKYSRYYFWLVYNYFVGSD